MWDRIKDFFYRQRVKITGFIYWVVKSIQYSRFLWHDYDWDYYHILRLLQYKLGRMRKYLQDHGHLERTPDTIIKLAIAESMLEDLLRENFGDDLRAAHKEKWGEIQFNSGKIEYENAKTPEQIKEANLDIIAMGKIEEQRRRVAYDRTFAFIRKYIQEWWD